MTTEVQLALVNNAPQIILAVTSLVGAFAAYKGWRKSDHNSSELNMVKEAIANNDVKTDEVGKAVNGRMTAFIQEIERRHEASLARMEEKNAATLSEAVKAARLDAEKNALLQITCLKNQIAMAKTDHEVTKAIEEVQNKLLNPEG